MASPHFYTTFPGKQLYTITALTSNLISLPFYLTYYIFPSNRPCSKWTYNQSIRILLGKAFIKYISLTESGTILTLLPKTEGTRFCTINPAPASHYQGVSTSNPSITPEIIGGTWYPAPPSPSEDPTNNIKIVLHFHGGAYVVGDGRTKDSGFAAKTFLSHTNATHVFIPQYRLANDASRRFPAALQDAVTSYYYLISTLQIPPENIVVSGDSAGGNLTLTLLRYIYDNPGAGLPNPGCAWLWSAWVDVGRGMKEEIFRENRRAASDYVHEKLASWGAKGLAPLEGTGVKLTDACISYIGNAFKSATPMFFTAGECEVLFDDIVRVYGEFTALGNKTQLQIDGNAVHDIMLIGDVVGFEEEAVAAVKKAGEFWEGCRV
ncbi:299fa181-8441-458c-93d7-08248e88d0bb [Sclerotinia trifoliorum]|uniref:299fa181-8441-458c-93d7-08248e88d0bb n=1 Tax=Sclerotinia trifoliorum TaxID=28548 RepID=A0A8H2VS71_9HELO|nr:299fa181-8441-458c-93d7-08248e88d0bb [Sclerotinia trifoliorum]